MRSTFTRFGAGILAVGLFSALSWAAEPAGTAPTTVVATPAAHHQFRTSTLEGMKVQNVAGEDLGKVKDFVIDMGTGKISYAALDFGGFLGLGDKYFAIPWSAFKYQSDGKERHLVLNISKEQLKDAPGFDKSHWPDMADPNWSHDVDTYYGHAKTAAR